MLGVPSMVHCLKPSQATKNPLFQTHLGKEKRVINPNAMDTLDKCVEITDGLSINLHTDAGVPRILVLVVPA